MTLDELFHDQEHLNELSSKKKKSLHIAYNTSLLIHDLPFYIFMRNKYTNYHKAQLLDVFIYEII